MAFAIHTQVGKHCVAGKIAHKLVSRDHTLTSGDQVEIITSESQKPEASWLEYCKTVKAQNCLRALIRRDRRDLAERGRQIFEQILEEKGIENNKETMSRILGKYHLRTPQDLYLMMANDELNLSIGQDTGEKSSGSMLSKLWRLPFSSKRKNSDESHPTIDRRNIYVLLPNATPPNYRIDSCCSPIPGDDVLGFVSADEQVILHKADCPVAMKLKSSYGTRLVATRWEGKADNFIVTLDIDGIDRKKILEQITACISSEMELNIINMNFTTEPGVFHCTTTLQVDTTDTVAKLCKKLKKIKGVKFAKRTS
jgi:GTP pyrophosphokinase